MEAGAEIDDVWIVLLRRVLVDRTGEYLKVVENIAVNLDAIYSEVRSV